MSQEADAKLFAVLAHGKQLYGDRPYVEHLHAVANVLREFGNFDDDLLAAAYLHDIIEDTPVMVWGLADRFSAEVVLLVSLVTSQPGKNRKERNAATYPGIALHPKAITLKLADRIANVRAGIANRSPLVEMYRREYPEFKKALQREHHQAMWAELDRLLEREEGRR